MTEFEEICEWLEDADNLICALSKDKVENILLTAGALYQAYRKGVDSGIFKSNNSPRE